MATDVIQTSGPSNTLSAPLGGARTLRSCRLALDCGTDEHCVFTGPGDGLCALAPDWVTWGPDGQPPPPVVSREAVQ